MISSMNLVFNYFFLSFLRVSYVLVSGDTLGSLIIRKSFFFFWVISSYLYQ